MRGKRMLTGLIVAMGLTLGLLGLLRGPGTRLAAVRAAGLQVCPSGCAYSSIQAAVDAAGDSDVIKVAAGTYAGVSTRAGVTQTVYITKSVAIRGGYTPAFTEPPDPEANPTTLDAQQEGRVVYVTGNITATLEGLHITGGYVEASGGGIYADGANLVLVGTVISNNISNGANWDGGLGGGVYVGNGTATLHGGRIISNSASFKGGGLLVWNGTATLDGVQISHNAAHGPTVWDGGGGLFVLGSATLNGGQIISNTAGYGGGVYVYRSEVTANGAQIIKNYASSLGGGVYIWPDSRMTMNGGEISSNSTWGGGGVYIWPAVPDYGWGPGSMTLNQTEISSNSASVGGGVDSAGILTLANSVVFDNRADVGSGLHIGGGSSQLLHTTIVHNLGGEGSGVSVEGSATVAMTNTILATHTVGITSTAGSTVTLESTLWYGNIANWDGTGIIYHSNDLAGDPAFVAPEAGDYHIAAGSAAIDAGVDAGVTEDMDGDPRPLDGDDDGAAGFDIGADELKPQSGPLGDVNDDGQVDSTDALIVLSADAGIDTAQFCPINCGDANGDGLVDSTDALIILSYDAGMSVPFPVGQPGCPSSVTQPPGCTS